MVKVELSYNIYRPDDYALGIIQIIHGMSEHSQRYAKFAKFLCKKGFVVITYDHRGHGNTCNSNDELGFFDSQDGWIALVEDAHSITEVVKKEYPPDVPFILFGHSMGSLVARSYLKKYDYELNGLILSGAPNYQMAAPLGIHVAKHMCKKYGEKARSPLLEKLATGSMNDKIANPKTKFDWLSKNEENVQSYINDPLCGFPFTNRGYQDLFWGMCDMHRLKGWKCTKKSLPIFFVAGECDPVTGGNKGLLSSINRLKRAGYTTIFQNVYPQLRHEILNEVEQEQVFNDILQWIMRYCVDKKV